jgi:hypothetical protein
MKKWLGLWALLVAVFVVAGLISGCEESLVLPTTTTITPPTVTTTSTTTTTTSTTPTTMPQAYVDISKTGAAAANAASDVGGLAGNMGDGLSNMSASSVKAMAVNVLPPESFFDVDLLTGPASIDGFVLATSEAAGGNVAPYVRYWTVGGDLVAEAYLKGKRIAVFTGITLRDIFLGNVSGATWTTAIGTWAGTYGALIPNQYNPGSPLFTTVSNEVDYLAYAYIYPSVEATAGGGLPAGAHFTTIEAGATDKVATMECKLEFSNIATGEMSLNIPINTMGAPADGDATGTGTIYAAGYALDSSLLLGFLSGQPTTVNFNASVTPGDYVVDLTVNPLTGVGTGELYDDTGTLIGTMEVNATGGTVYVGGTSEAFTF